CSACPRGGRQSCETRKFFAQEVVIDGKKKYQEQARELVDELQQERDSMNSQTNKLKQQLQKDMDVVREEEVKLKSRLSLLEQENNRLEQELHEKELLIVPDLKQKLADLESHHNELQEQNHQSLLQEIEKFKMSNQELQDKIDELTLEIENMHQSSTTDTTPSKAVNRTHSWLESSSEENSDEESPTIGKLRRTFFSNGKQSHEIEGINLPIEIKKTVKGNQPTTVDILLKDMMHDQSRLLRKLQIAEESRMRIERAYRQSENKNKILSGLVRSMSGAISA
ncbi:uncharacterized protein CEXT_672221, partial [Caerostris extrusa]